MEKPRQIRELETYYGIEFQDGNAKAADFVHWDTAKYSLNQDGELIGLSLRLWHGQSYKGLAPLANIKSLRSLDLSNCELEDVRPLGALPGLRSLNLSSCRIADITALSDLHRLRFLNLSDAPVADIRPLSGLRELEALVLSGSALEDIAPLSALRHLRSLDLSANKIVNICPLADLSDLRSLYLSGNQISDLFPLTGLRDLLLLVLSSNQINDIHPLADLVSLRSLDLSRNPIGDLSPLSGLIDLQSLTLIANQITDIAPLSGLRELRSLNLSNGGFGGSLYFPSGFTDEEASRVYNSPDDFLWPGEPYEDAGRLFGAAFASTYSGRDVYFPVADQAAASESGGNQITDIRPLKDLHNLRFLDLSGNRITDATPLSGLPNLQNLYMSDNRLEEVALQNLKHLASLFLAGNTVRSIVLHDLPNISSLNLAGLMLERFAFEGVDNLGALDLSGNRIRSLASLSDLHGLTSLDLSRNQVSDITPLSGLDALKSLNLSHNELRDIDALSGLTELTELDASYNQLPDITLENFHHLERLEFSGNPLRSLALKNMPKITALNLSRLRLEEVALAGLAGLARLDLSGNSLSKIASWEGLSGLAELNLAANRISDLSFLPAFQGLAHLNLSANRIIQAAELAELTSLTHLNLRGNQIADLSFLRSLPGLVDLDIDLNPIADYHFLRRLPLLEILKLKDDLPDIEYLRNAQYLRQIYFSGSSLKSEIVDFLSDKDLFPNLTTIGYKPAAISLLEQQVDCQLSAVFPGPVTGMIDNQTFTLNNKGELTGFRLRRKQLTDLSFLEGYTALEVLDLRLNNISDVSVLKGLGELRELHLYGNNITHIPVDFFDSLPKMEYVNLRGNPIGNIPQEIFDKDENVLEAVRTYLRSLQGERRYLHQAKMILVGNGKVGKSSIRIKLMDRKAPLPTEEERTQGLDIETYTIENLTPDITGLKENINFDLLIWDFGGQGKYREVQQLFCGRKALYLFVTSIDDNPDKEDYIGFEYWLSMAKAYGYDEKDNWQSPVLHVVNKCDLGKKLVNEEALVRTFDNIHEFVKISCATLQNFDDLERNIKTALPKVSRDVFANQFSKKWFAVKEALDERRRRNYINLSEYREVCKEKGLNEAEGNMWLDYLDRIGALIYFRDDPALNDFIVLNPLWVKDAMYKTLDSKFIRDGRLLEELLPVIWTEYNAFEHRNLLSIMLAYKFCYPQTDSQGGTFYAIPALFPENKPAIPEFLIHYDYELRFAYAPFIPAGTVNKLMVELHPYIYQDLKWKNGCILHMAEDRYLSFAEVTEDWDKKSVLVRIGGHNHRAVYNLVRKTLAERLRDLKKMKFLDDLEMTVKVKVDEEYYPLKAIIQFGRKTDFPFLFAEVDSIREGKERQVFLSYAWASQGDVTGTSEAIVNRLYQALKDDGFNVIRDKTDMDYKDLISEFMERIGQIDKVVVVLNDRYLQSDYCMFELYEIARTSKFEKKLFQEKVVPIMAEPIRITETEVIKMYANHWEEKSKKWKDLITSQFEQLADENYNRYKNIERISREIGRLMEWLADMNMLTPATLATDNFAIIKEALTPPDQ